MSRLFKLAFVLVMILGGYFYYVRGWDFKFETKDLSQKFFSDVMPSKPSIPKTGTRWETLQPMLTPRSDAGAAVIDGKIYVVGGTDGYARTLRSVEIYDIETGAWSNGPPMPQALHRPAVATDGKRLYVLGGMVGLISNLVDTAYMFEPTTGQWSELGRLDDFRGAAGAAVVLGKLFIVGGVDQIAVTNIVDQYDAGRGGWDEVTSMSVPRSHLAAVSIDDRLYAIGGRSHSPDGELDVVEVYNADSGKWSSLEPMLTERSGFGAAVVGGTIYAIGGEDADGIVAQVGAYDTTTGIWHPFGNMPNPRSGVSVVAHENRVYTLGGGKRVGFSVSDLNEVLIIE